MDNLSHKIGAILFTSVSALLSYFVGLRALHEPW